MDNTTKWLLVVFVLLNILYLSLTTPEGRERSLQSMREQDNPEYYILQELRKDK